MEYDNTNRGVLFTNKKTKENQPDKTGQINIQGKIWELSGWNKTSSKGNEFTSLVAREPVVKEAKATETKNDIPW
jgi:hypothetical protein